jgi:hypothetical protein
MSRLRKNQGSYQGIALQLAEKLRFRIWVSLQRYRKFLQIRRPFRGCGLTAGLQSIARSGRLAKLNV